MAAVGAELLEHHLLRVVNWGGGAVCLYPVMLSILLGTSQDFVQLYIFIISESSLAWHSWCAPP